MTEPKKPHTKTVNLNMETFGKLEEIRSTFRPFPSRRALVGLLIADKYQELLDAQGREPGN